MYYHYAEGDMRFLQQRVVRAELETKKAGQELMQVREEEGAWASKQYISASIHLIAWGS